MGIKSFFKNAFKDMKESTKAQREVDKANFRAVKAESKANFEEAKAMSKPQTRKKIMQAKRDEQIVEAKKREEEANARINSAKNGN